MEDTKTRPFPQSLRTIKVQLLYAVAMPLFFFFFVLFFHPSRIYTFLEMGGGQFVPNLVLMSIVCLVVMALIRVSFWNNRDKLPQNWGFYMLWCLSEIFVIALASAIFLTLTSRGACSFFGALVKCILYYLSILVYPYVIIALLAPDTIEEKTKIETAPEEEVAEVKFYDENHRLKMVLDPSVILYIRAEENYVRVNYLENDRRKDFALRTSMRSIEDMVPSSGLVRCHRSYYVNPAFISALIKGKEGAYLAELKMEKLGPVPVSKKYFEILSELLKTC